jgi:hypothetical protein
MAYKGVVFMNGRKIIYIDVSEMTEQELCETLDIEYVPWYRSGVFWALAVCFGSPSVVMAQCLPLPLHFGKPTIVCLVPPATSKQSLRGWRFK